MADKHNEISLYRIIISVAFLSSCPSTSPRNTVTQELIPHTNYKTSKQKYHRNIWNKNFLMQIRTKSFRAKLTQAC